MTQQILQLLQRHSQGLSLSALARELNLAQCEKPLLKQRLRELEERGLILRLKRKYLPLPPARLYSGRVKRALGRGLLVIRESAEEEEIFVPQSRTKAAVPGDRVKLAVTSSSGRREGPEGRIVGILERGRATLVGLYRESGGRALLQPFDAPFAEEVPVTLTEAQPLAPDAVVEIDRETHRLVRILGSMDAPGVDLEVVIHNHDLPSVFSPEALAEAEAVAEPSSAVLASRADFRNRTIFTIDGEDAADFDDAVSLALSGDGFYHLGVHIADVSYFVLPGTCLDQEAFQRGTSVYFPQKKVLPMLPDRLSRQLCSLVPGKDRLTLSVLMDFDPQGHCVSARFVPAVIRSVARLTYPIVQRIIDGGREESLRYPALRESLEGMRRLAQVLRRNRIREGGLVFAQPEPRLRYAGEKIVGIDALVPQEAHGIIEEFMLAANQAVAAYLEKHRTPLLYRIHPPPPEKSLFALRNDLARFGISLPPADQIEARDLHRVQEQVRERPGSAFFTRRILKSLRLAAYSPHNQGHYGLGKDVYTHFTSPIRRYPDLVTHRALKHTLKGELPRELPLEDWGRMCSERERRADEAERDLMEWRICRFLQTRLGDEFWGVATDISRAGLVVELEDMFISGIILFQDLGDEFFAVESETKLRGARSGSLFSLGDRLRVRLAAVDPRLRRMLLIPVRE